MSLISEANLIYNWNLKGRRAALAPEIMFFDETLRDGIQGPSISDPAIEQKLRIVELEEMLGIHSLDVGLPGAGPRAVSDVSFQHSGSARQMGSGRVGSVEGIGWRGPGEDRKVEVRR